MSKIDLQQLKLCRMQLDPVIQQYPASIFSSVEAIAGIGSIKHTSDGIAIRATSGTIEFLYSTHFCADFYNSRGREKQQLCHDPIPALVTLLEGGPSTLTCA